MKITNLHLKNFRCFKDYELSLGEQTTVFIGKNGTGKSSVITALKYALSFIFSKYKVDDYTLLNNLPDLRVANLSKMDSYFDIEMRAYLYPISIRGKGRVKYADQQINWALVKNEANGRPLYKNYKDAFVAFTEHFNQDIQNSELPILAYFSDSYPHKKINIGAYAKKVLKNGNFSRAFGYYLWDAESNCAEIWQHRYISQYAIISDYKNEEQETQVEREEIQFIDDRIKCFTQPLRDDLPLLNKEFEVKKIRMDRPLKDEVYILFEFKDGREILFENLPQGYNRLFSIVFDITYRSHIINPGKEPNGIVFIDEIELHLHPALQQEVLQRLRKTFPQVQFIVTTHSPLVISNLNADGDKHKIIKLENDGIHYTTQAIGNIFGVDYPTSLMDIMDAQYRPSTIDNLIDSYVILKLHKKEKEADEIWNKIFELVGKDNVRLKEEIADKIEANK